LGEAEFCSSKILYHLKQKNHEEHNFKKPVNIVGNPSPANRERNCAAIHKMRPTHNGT
jgi:hypothetical protein